MMDDVENGESDVCIMKDLTRWGRDYLQAGNTMEIFRQNNVRFINIMSEWHAKEISKKEKTGIKTKRHERNADCHRSPLQPYERSG